MANERRLIDADELREAWLLYGANENIYSTNDVLESIDAAPTVDTVEVVRCKDCKWFADNNGGEWYGCWLFNGISHGQEDIPAPDDFCSYGEKREVE